MSTIEIISTIIIMLGIVLIYDARLISKKIFSISDQNGASFALKIVGFFMTVIRRNVNINYIKKGIKYDK